MAKYNIDSEKLKSKIDLFMNDLRKVLPGAPCVENGELSIREASDLGAYKALEIVLSYINSLQQEQPNNMIQWTGTNLKEVIDFTGKNPRLGEWFKSWEEYETYVHTHNDILKLFFEDGGHYEVPVGAWIIKTPDGYNVPSVAKYIQQEQLEVDLEKEMTEYIERHFHVRYDETLEVGNGPLTTADFEEIARHFTNFGLNARRRNNYDSSKCTSNRRLGNGRWHPVTGYCNLL